jgi:hypothetical protein
MLKGIYKQGRICMGETVSSIKNFDWEPNVFQNYINQLSHSSIKIHLNLPGFSTRKHIIIMVPIQTNCNAFQFSCDRN